jgi:hypothetical protein
MATVNLGRIKPVFRGAYSGSTAYVVDDIVTSANETYICIQAHGAGTQAVSQAAYWTKLAAKGTDGTDVGTTITTQGDILYRDGSGLQRLAAGTNGQFLKTQGSGANPVWGNVTSKIGQVVNMTKTDTTSINATSYTDVSGCSISITPSATDSKILLMANYNGYSHDQYYYHRFVRDISGGTSNTVPTNWVGDAAGSRVQSSTGNNYRATGSGDNNTSGMWPFWNIDSPNTTSACTYKMQARSSGGSYTMYYGRSSNDTDNTSNSRTPAIVMIAWEILA